MVFIHLQDAEPGVIISNSGLTFDFSRRGDFKGQLRDTKLIALRGQHLTVGVLARNSRESGQIAVITGVIPEHRLAVRALYFDQGVRQIVRAGQISLGNTHVLVHQFIDNRRIQVDHDFILRRLELF